MLKKIKEFFYLKYHYSKTTLGLKDYIRNVIRVFYCPTSSFIDQINDDKSLIEIGCGAGPITFLISNRFPKKTLTGFDIDRHSISIANQANTSSNIKFFTGKPSRRDISSYDAVILFDVLHHMTPEQQIEVLEDISFTQQQGNRIYVKCLDSEPRRKVIFNNITDYISSGSKCHYIGIKALVEELKSNGYEIEYRKKIKFSLWSHYIVVGKKK